MQGIRKYEGAIRESRRSGIPHRACAAEDAHSAFLRNAQTLRGSTLVETLVMMLVTGIVFLAVMDGLTLFTRLQTRRAEILLTNGRQRDGYFRVESLVTGADSLVAEYSEFAIYREGRRSSLSQCDSVLVYRSGGFQDTLLTGVVGLKLFGIDPDTLEVLLAVGFRARFPVTLPAREQYRRSVDEIEKSYGYEE